MPITGDRYTFSQENINRAPAKPGVYALYSGDTLIYYGSATTSIQDRLQSHFNGNDGTCTQQATSYRREPCSNPRQREKELLVEFQAANRRLPKCNDVMP